MKRQDELFEIQNRVVRVGYTEEGSAELKLQEDGAVSLGYLGEELGNRRGGP